MNERQDGAAAPSNTHETDFPTAGRDGYWIRILFHGLLAGWADNNHLCVGALNGLSDHFLKLTLHERNGPMCQFTISESDPIKLIATNEHYNGIHQLRLPIKDAVFDIYGDRVPYYGQQYRHDFRWLLDFERVHKNDHDVAGQRLTKKCDRLQPRFQINTGLLYTLVRSIPLLVKRENCEQYLGRSAQIFAVNLYATNNSSAMLHVGNNIQIVLSQKAKWDIVLRNDCPYTNPVKPKDPVDTSMLNDAFDPPKKAGYFSYLSAIDPNDRAEKEWWNEEQKCIDFGADLGDIYPYSRKKRARDARTDPCGEAFFG
jgi:hypothetical protein